MTAEQLTVYRGCTPVVDAQYETDSEKTPVEAIINALATAEGVAVNELPPLYDTIDPDALNQLFQSHDGRTDAETVLSFTVGKWNVFVRADGRIRVCDGTRPTDPEPVFESCTA